MAPPIKLVPPRSVIASILFLMDCLLATAIVGCNKVISPSYITTDK